MPDNNNNNNMVCVLCRFSCFLVFVALSNVVTSENSAIGVGELSIEQSDEFEYDEKNKIQVSNGKEVINSTLTRNGQQREIIVTVFAFNETFVLELSLNRYLFATGYTEKSVRRNGQLYRSVNHTESHCYYVGKVRQRPHSTAAVSTCRGIVGHFTIDNTSYNIEPIDGTLNGTHKVYRNRPNAKNIYRCGTEHDYVENLLSHDTFRRRMRRSFRWPQDEDTNKVVEIYVANDAVNNALYDVRGSDPFERTKDIVNIASSLYQPLGIYLVLVGMEVWSEDRLIAVNYSDSVDTLYKWYTYRMNNIVPFHPHDSGVLITSRSFLGGVIGRAVGGYMCSYKYSGAVVSDIYSAASTAGNTVAHEIGHTFGMAHDNASCQCDDSSGACIMNAYTNLGNPGSKWSSCSLNTLEMFLDEGVDLCLYNIPPTVLQASPLCGNGIVEDGEDCDCGKAPTEDCNSDCCDSETCRLIGPATCAYGQCCDVSKCQTRPSSDLCRKRISVECDLDEYCNGINSTCPANTYKPDGTSCTVKGDSSFCYQGHCRSHQSQCSLVWGPDTQDSEPICYTYFNRLGTYYGNCGSNLTDGTYYECLTEDVLCGRLHCKVNQTDALFKYQNYLFKSEASIGTTLCTSVLFDYGLDTNDPGMAPDGAKCGEGKMCIGQKCVNVNSVKVACSDSCEKQEVCNNIGICQRISIPSVELTSKPPDTSTDSNHVVDPTLNDTIRITTKTASIVSSSTTRTTTTSTTTTTTPTTTSIKPTSTTTTTPTSTTTTTTTTTPKSTTTSTTTTTRPSTTTSTSTLKTSTATTTTPTTTPTTTYPTSSLSRLIRLTPPMTAMSSSPSSKSTNLTATSTSTPSMSTLSRRLTPVPTEYRRETTVAAVYDPQSSEGAFSVYLEGNQTGTTSLLHLNGLLANRVGGFHLSTGFFIPRLTIDQFIYTEICAGLLPYTTAQLKTLGCYPYLTFDWMSTSHDGTDSVCRGGVLSASMDLLISLSQTGGGLYGSDLLPTSWSMFSITDTMLYSDRLLSLFGGRASAATGAVPLQNQVATPSAPFVLYDPSGYSCTREAGAHFFSMSVGVPAGSATTVQLQMPGSIFTFEMTRENSRTTGTTTLARTILAPCSTDAQMVLTGGRIVPGVNLISFTAFPYQLRRGKSVAWAAYKTTNVPGSGAVTYDLWLAKMEVTLTRSNTTVVVPITGFYYVYISAGVLPESPLGLVILNNGEPLFGLSRTSKEHTGVDTIGHGMVVSLSKNDMLRVQATTGAYSSDTGLHTSFIGMLLYED